MTPDEVRMLDNKYALLFIRGERPIIDLKYNTFNHPNIKLTEDGGYKPYIHGNTKNAIATISIDTLRELHSHHPRKTMKEANLILENCFPELKN